jgi:hypothetical protein
MGFGGKARRCSVFFIQGAPRQIKEIIARTAVKIMVMRLAGSFIEDPQLGVFDNAEPSGCNKQLQVSIDGGLIQRFDPFTACLQDFLNPQGPIFPQKNILNGISLGCISYHELRSLNSLKELRIMNYE